ncbi:hypothetical protein Tsubulata_037314 [Turnera subulata]|uniref:R13L1/DRL21-like LRR repeat region domain-containing protein n=1 Tax=Turnera subulata TaxID=218843 RepID=A0A9Q0F5T3_9ROSI|nr:hypothetical protein Tsubulata_037314 [Turnera subulata]
MTNLRHLDIRDTHISEMPPQLCQLTKLVVLTDFYVGKQNSSSIAELGPLDHLQGELCVWNLENIVGPSDAIEANLKGKRLIDKLELRWNPPLEHDSLCEHNNVLEHLRPSTNLKDLGIYFFPGVRFPNWLGDHCFSNLSTLSLTRGRYCTELPPLGQLQSLKELSISGCDRIVTVGPELYGNCSSSKKAFASLQKLKISKMTQLQLLMPPTDGGKCQAFPLLRELHMEDCPKLKRILPDYCLPSLTVLETTGRVDSFPRAPSIYVFRFADSSRLEKSPTGLYKLEVKGFSYTMDTLLKALEGLGCSDSTLQSVVVDGCNEIQCFPSGRFENLSHLVVRDCLHFEECFCGDGEGSLASLHSLRILQCHIFFAFPEGGLAAPNLRVLELHDTTALELLPKHMHSLLPSLVELRLLSCTKLKSFPEGGLPSTIEKLEILWCHELESSPEGGFPPI